MENCTLLISSEWYFEVAIRVKSLKCDTLIYFIKWSKLFTFHTILNLFIETTAIATFQRW
jgi:hypothetical protein